MLGWQVQDILGANIRRVRRELGYTQAELAERAGLSPGYVCDIERSRRWPSAENIARLAEVLKVDPFQLLLPTLDTPYFDRHRTLTAFRRELETMFESSMNTVLDSMLKPYGPLRPADEPPEGGRTEIPDRDTHSGRTK